MNETVSNCNWQSSEQAGDSAEWTSPARPISSSVRVRALGVALKHAESVIGECGGPGLHMRAQTILDNARLHVTDLDARLYEIAWFVNSSLLAPRMLSSNVQPESDQALSATGNHAAISDPEKGAF